MLEIIKERERQDKNIKLTKAEQEQYDKFIKYFASLIRKYSGIGKEKK